MLASLLQYSTVTLHVLLMSSSSGYRLLWNMISYVNPVMTSSQSCEWAGIVSVEAPYMTGLGEPETQLKYWNVLVPWGSSWFCGSSNRNMESSYSSIFLDYYCLWPGFPIGFGLSSSEVEVRHCLVVCSCRFTYFFFSVVGFFFVVVLVFLASAAVEQLNLHLHIQFPLKCILLCCAPLLLT